MHASDEIRGLSLRFSITVPATSANLGPGFDAVGVALGLHVHAEVEPAEAFELSFLPGSYMPTHTGFNDVIVAAMKRIAPELPAVRVRVTNEIPLGKGLGSSAAAVVLGLVIASRAHGVDFSRRKLAHLAAEIEGHPDNALPAIFGGAVIAAMSTRREEAIASTEPPEHAELSFVRIPVGERLRALLIVPEFDFATAQARALLPDSYTRADVIFTAQRAALLGAALGSSSWEMLREAMQDRIHQPYRAPEIPGMVEALEVRSPHVFGIALSGAGPSVLALCDAHAPWRDVAKELLACFTRAGTSAKTYWLPISGEGYAIDVHHDANDSLALMSRTMESL